MPFPEGNRRYRLRRGPREGIRRGGVPLQIGSALRGRRVFHPRGVLATGRITRCAPEGVGLPIESADVVGRVSKASAFLADGPT